MSYNSKSRFTDGMTTLGRFFFSSCKGWQQVRIYLLVFCASAKAQGQLPSACPVSLNEICFIAGKE